MLERLIADIIFSLELDRLVADDLTASVLATLLHAESAKRPVALTSLGGCALPWACDSSQAQIQAVKLTGWKAPLWLAALLPEPLMLPESPDRSELNTDPP